MSDLRALLGDRYFAVMNTAALAIKAPDLAGPNLRRKIARRMLAAVLPDLLAAAWDEGYRQAVTDHLLQYDNSDDTPNPYRSGDPR